MKRERILITVKTYPTLSQKYKELVCTAGFREDGSWIRVYPLPYRQLGKDKQYSKYQWITLDLERNLSDFRPESYKPLNLHNAVLGEKLDTKKDPSWLKRRETVLKKGVHRDLVSLFKEAKDPVKGTSLAVFKPKEIIDLKVKKYSEQDMDKYLKRRNGLMESQNQMDLFHGKIDPFEIVEKIPYKFSYHLIDDKGVESTMMIEDWEIIQLYRNVLRTHGGDEEKAKEDVRKKYIDDFARTKDLHLFLGTTKANHKRAPNPFIIIGTFHPKPDLQTRLFSVGL